MSNKVYLIIAILTEVIATSSLKAANGFNRPGYLVVAVICYTVAFSCLSFALRTVPIGVAYAIWSGSGICLLAVIGWVVYRQQLQLIELIGMALILCGVLVTQLAPRA